MAFRYLIYRTDFGNTIVRESPTNTSTGGTEQSLFTDFIIPAIQPLYLWRVSGGTSVIPNTDQNIYDWLQNIAPELNPEDSATVGYVTGLTSQKINIVTGATGNVGVFLADGNLEDSGFSISEITGATSAVTYSIFNAYTGATETRLQDIESDLDTISGQTDTNTSNISTVSATTENKIDKVTGATGNVGIFLVNGNLEDSGYSISELTGSTTGGTSITLFNSYTGTTETRLQDIEGDIVYLSGQTDLKLNISDFTSYTGTTDTRLQGIENDITFLSGQTDLKLNITDFNLYTGTTETRLQNIENDITGITASTITKTTFNTYTGTTETRLQNIEGDIDSISGITEVALTGATNGLTKSGRNVELGGTLNKDTIISGITHDFTLNVADITLQSTGSINVIDTSGNGVDIESDAGTVDIIGNTSLSVERTKLTISESQMLITDNRGTTVGLQYADDYSTDFTARSLVDKGYVDAIAEGLIPKAAVNVATTSNIDLTGGTFTSGSTIDSETVLDGWRVLVKDQTDGTENGIWVFSGSSDTFYRAEDFNGTPDGEITNGNIVPVISGNTNYNTLWVLVTPNPITLGTSDLEFTLFSSPHELIGGTGINIVGNTISVNGASLVGNSISWTGNTFNVDINSGTLSTALNSKLNITDFNSYSGTTDSRLDSIESDIVTLSGQTENKLETSIFTGYTATTETRLQGIESDITFISGVTDTKLDTNIFTGYTANTASNEIFLIHTGGTELNTILTTAIEWDDVIVSGSSYSWTGGSDIYIQETAKYEASYNIPYNSQQNNRDIAIGVNLILNNNTVLDTTSAAAQASDNGIAANIALPTVVLSLSSGDKLTLGGFRIGDNGTSETLPNASILIKKKETLQ